MNLDRMELVRGEVRRGKGERHAIYEGQVKANADRWLKRVIVIPEVGGWVHNFFCTDGSQLEIPDDQLFDPDRPSRCPTCGRTYLNEKILGARRFLEHYWLASAVRDLALTHAISAKEPYAAKATEILTKYADAYSNRAGLPGRARLAGGIMDISLTEAVCLIPWAEAYDLVCATMTAPQREHIERNLLWPAAQALTYTRFGGNWGSWHLSAIGVIGYATRHQRFIEFATERFKEQISKQLGDDGLWPESVHTYHFFPLDCFLAFAEAAANCGDDLYNWEAKPGKSLKSMFTAPLRYAYPNMRLPAINDGWYDAFLPQDQYMMAYYRYHLPEFAWAVREIRRGGKSGAPGDYLARHYRNLIYDEKLPTDIARPALNSINFPNLGIVVLRQGSHLGREDEMMLTFDYGPYLGHGHLDKMGVTLFAHGKLVAPDYGTTGYGVELTRFLRSTPAHNTIVIDGKDQKRAKDRNLIAFKDTPGFKLSAARTSELDSGVSWTRAVMLMDAYAVLWDRIAGTEQHQYDWFFHAEGESLSLGGTSDNRGSKSSADEFSYPFIAGVRRFAIAENVATAKWGANADGLDVCLLTRPGQVAFTAQFPTPEARPVPLLVLRETSQRGEFLAVLRPWKGKEKAASGAVRILRQDGGAILVMVPVGKRMDRIHIKEGEITYENGAGDPVSAVLPPDHK